MKVIGIGFCIAEDMIIISYSRADF